MPGNASSAMMQSDMLSGIEEETDIYEGFAPHVDTSSLNLSADASPGEFIIEYS